MGLVKSLISSSKDALFIADAETGKIVFANEAASRLMETPISGLIGKLQSELCPEEDRPEMTQKFYEFMQSDSYKELEVRIITPTGIIKKALITSAQVYQEAGKTYGVAFFKDLTPEERLNDIAFLQSHEVRRHAANILGITQLFEEHLVTEGSEEEQLIDKLCQLATDLEDSINKVTALTQVQEQISTPNEIKK